MVVEDDEEQTKENCTKTLKKEQREYAVFHPFHELTDREIDQFLIVAR